MAEMSEEFEELTEEESAQLNEVLNLKKDETVQLSELNDMLSKIEQIYDAGKYSELLEHIQNAMSSGESTFKRFYGIGLSIAILSSQRWMDSIKDLDMTVEDEEEHLNQAKRNFLDDRYEDTLISISNFRDMTSELQEKQKEKLSEMIKNIGSHIEDARNIGSNVIQVESLIKDAKAKLENDMLIKCAETVRKAQVLIGEAGEERIAVIKEAMTFVESIIEQAKGIGADVEAASKHLEKARAFFDNKDFQMCMHTTIQAEEMTTELIQNQVDRALALKKSLEDRYRAVAFSREPETVQFEEIPSEEKMNCTTCGNPLEYIEQYKRWYCYTCLKYV